LDQVFQEDSEYQEVEQSQKTKRDFMTLPSGAKIWSRGYLLRFEGSFYHLSQENQEEVLARLNQIPILAKHYMDPGQEMGRQISILNLATTKKPNWVVSFTNIISRGLREVIAKRMMQIETIINQKTERMWIKMMGEEKEMDEEWKMSYPTQQDHLKWFFTGTKNEREQQLKRQAPVQYPALHQYEDVEILELDDNSENLIFTQYRKQRQAQAKAKMDKKMKVDDATQKRFITKGGKVRFAGVKSSSEASNAEKNSRRVHQMSESETEETTTSSTPSSHTQQDNV
jgi:hypothetical protein